MEMTSATDTPSPPGLCPGGMKVASTASERSWTGEADRCWLHGGWKRAPGDRSNQPSKLIATTPEVSGMAMLSSTGPLNSSTMAPAKTQALSAPRDSGTSKASA